MTKFIVCLAAVLVLLVLVMSMSMHEASEVQGQERAPLSTPVSMEEPKPDSYYMTLFASQNLINRAYCSHTFATFSMVDDQHNVTERTVSWLPRSQEVKILKAPEPGVNLNLERTLSWAASVRGVTVNRW